MQQPGRKYSSGSDYRYGFNGKELDKETIRTTTYDYGFRIYSPSLSRFLSVDPLFKSYPWYTPYQFAGNKPISCIDLEGLEEKDKVGTMQFDLMDGNTIWVGTVTTAYAGKQKEALKLSSSNPSKLAVLQQESYNSVVAKVADIVLKNFDPNVRWDLQAGYTDKIGAELASSYMLEGKEVSNYNSYTDYNTPGQLIQAGTTIAPELTSIANSFIVEFATDKVLNSGRNREAIEKETDPNKKMDLIAKMQNDNQNARVALLFAAFSLAPEATNSPSPGRFQKFASSEAIMKESLSSMHYGRLQMVVRGVSDEMNAFFKSNGKVIPARESLLKYRELTSRIVNNTGGVPASKRTSVALKMQTDRLNMI